MKILTIGLDNTILDKNSALAKRVLEYGDLTEKYTIIVPNKEKRIIDLSDKVKAYGSGGKNKILQYIKIYGLAKNILKQEKFSVVSIQDPYYLAIIGLMLARKHKIGLELQLHGWEKFYGLRKLIAEFTIKRAQALRVVSQRIKNQLITEFGIGEKKIIVVPIYIELRIRNQESRINKESGKFIFLTVGRLVPVKNIGLQIKVMAEIIKKYANSELWIIGAGPEKQRFELEIRNWKLENNVKLLGWQDNLENFYKQADVFLLTSNYEGWGLSVIEAASFGLPIIMTDVGCAGEVIIDNQSGLIIPVNDKEKLEQTMIKLLENEELRIYLGQGAKRAISFLPDRQQTLELYLASWKNVIKSIANK